MSRYPTLRAALITILSASVLTACAGPGDQRRGSGLGAPPVRAAASPSEIVAAEIAFARLARDEGQWTAFREYAADDAIMFVPEMVNAQDWLAGRSDPDDAVQWQSHAVYMSCDGLTAASTGAWQRSDGSTGYFTTIWRRELRGRRLGEWRWQLDHGDALPEPLEMDGDLIRTRVAFCDGPGGRRRRPPPPQDGEARNPYDDTLRWDWQTGPGNSRTVTVSLRTPQGYETVIEDRVARQTGN